MFLNISFPENSFQSRGWRFNLQIISVMSSSDMFVAGNTAHLRVMCSCCVRQYHNTWQPQTADRTCRWVRRCGWQVTDHPPYSRDLVHSDFHLFGSPNKYLTGKLLPTDADVKQANTSWLHTIGTDFLYPGIQSFLPWWDKRLNVSGDLHHLLSKCHA